MRALIPGSQGLEADLATGLFSGAYLEEATVASHSSLRQWVGTQETEVQGPDARVLCDGKGPEGTIKGATGVCYSSLVHEELAVV